MNIRWYGQSFFLFTASSGLKVVTDPFHDNVGYDLPDVSADIVTISHAHKDHNNAELVKEVKKVINEAGNYTVEGITINGYPSSHGPMLGDNIIFTYDIDGFKICHLGDLGVVLPDDTAQKIGPVDVLLLPIGGGMQVLNAKKAYTTMQKLRPKLTIPMHFKTRTMKSSFFMFSTEDEFLKMSKGKRLNSNSVVVEDAITDNGVLLLNYQ